MEKRDIQEQQTYQADNGGKFYVHDITGQKVSFFKIGESERWEASLGRFASTMSRQIPNE